MKDERRWVDVLPTLRNEQVIRLGSLKTALLPTQTTFLPLEAAAYRYQTETRKWVRLVILGFRGTAVCPPCRAQNGTGRGRPRRLSAGLYPRTEAAR